MRTRIFFVRHGESIHAEQGVIGGPQGCQGLTARGRRQAARLGRWITEEIGDDTASVHSSTLRRAVETAAAIAAVGGLPVSQDCGLCTWHTPPEADGLTHAEFARRLGTEGGGVYRPFQVGNETWAEMVTRTSRAVVDLAHRHRGETLVIVGHAETVEISFNALGLLPVHRSFDLKVSPASMTEWVTDQDPTQWPPPRWTLSRFNQSAPAEDVPASG
ncbi:phosphoglycerate mutase [Sphaerisporangium siamense]|uniref:Putative phosphoglycerate mutase n=1 Tax=Sphaerisporangium siamense TaxID=795645 RepID=A0A7W7D4M6_9ACTN|nr:histidine phosphatase family protein [Sphaerisporangium siamense]MBB4698706.1 putative phosphoglycerate mutase [Sphaerisporangium siamense]GII85235.1 phosphoglycerate mutase [Sphaerisporangium siamense]